jgi:hypothetical protein
LAGRFFISLGSELIRVEMTKDSAKIRYKVIMIRDGIKNHKLA